MASRTGPNLSLLMLFLGGAVLPAQERPAANGSTAAAAPPAAPVTNGFAPYTETIPGGAVSFDMVPIDGGTFAMGSPGSEAGRTEHEGPQIEVRVAPFWMGRCEVRWAEYDCWYEADLPQSKQPDGLSKPTPPYTDMTFNMGRDGYPAICVSHIAARQYCAWLSKVTGRFYRLPTEAEWEHACRAGTDTPWSCGDDPAALAEHAWFADNAGEKYHPVGQKQPNPWGLCDMHGNVAEWVADTWVPDLFAAAHGAAPRDDPFFPPPHDKRDRPIRFPHTVRGGSWQDPPEQLRSAARRGSEPRWNRRDPQIPRSWWYLTEGQHIGFRVVRPRDETPPERRRAFEDL
ncbi:MAG: formylglycine-generating enzyme family protein [Planctomycetota bacterium]